MAIPLTGTGGLFSRLGLIGGLVNSVNTYRGTTFPPKITTLLAQFQSTDQDTIDGIFATQDAFQASSASFLSAMKTLAQNTLIQMVQDDKHQISASSLSVCMNYLIAQMISGSQTVNACTVGGSVAAGGSNTGNAVLTFTMKRYDGLSQENLFAESVAGTCTNDAQSGSAVAKRETLTFTGQYAVSDALSWLYPAGSGVSVSLNCIDGSQSQGTGTQNMLNNSSFEAFASNVPTAWHVDVGTAGTTILQSAVAYVGTSSLNFVGNGSELTSVYQALSLATVTGDTTSRVYPLTQYAFNVWVKVDSTPAAGVIEFALTDGSGTVINDAQGTPNVITQALTSVSTSWVAVNGFFRLPRVLPSAVRLRIRLSTALTTGRNVYIDRAAFAQPIQLYQGGPGLAAFSGSTNLIAGDTYTFAPTNNYGGGFQRLFDKLFGMKSMNLLLPSSGSPTISDGLIT